MYLIGRLEHFCVITGLMPNNVSGIATGYWLDGQWIEIAVEARFSTPFQTGPKAHPAPYIMGTSSFSG
jgi:hypothetical protein